MGDGLPSIRCSSATFKIIDRFRSRLATCHGGCRLRLMSRLVRSFSSFVTVICLKEWREMPQGVIKKLVSDKGFGFIQGERGELFFHLSAIQGTTFESLREGQTVEYTEGQGPKGPRAESVTVLE